MRHLTRLEQLEYQINFLKEYRKQLDALIYFRENELKEVKEKEKVKKNDR